MRYFISGHTDLKISEFLEHYKPAIDAALAAGDDFIVCDAGGADEIAQNYIKSNGGKATVFHMLLRPRYNKGFETVGGFRSDEGRDKAATSFSDADIAWVRPGREKSGTAKNIARRKQ